MLKVTNLKKEFDTVVAVDNVSLEVKRGEMFGLLGPNGAGKTTTIRIILNIIQPDSGTITFDGRSFTQPIWNSIGYLPEERGLYRKSRIIHTLLYFASLKGLPSHQAKPLAYYWLERFGLKNEGHRRIEELSKGNQQKIQLIISILHSPQLLILDEPFAGLDPVNQVLLKDILLELRQKNTAIVFSTHQMDQVEKMCDTIYLINKGKQVLSGELYNIKKQYGTNSIHLEFEGDGEFLKNFAFVRRADVYQNYAELELTDITKSAELLVGIDGKLALRKYEIVEPSLNSIFLSVVGGSEKIVHGNEEPKPAPIIDSQEKSVSTKVMHNNRVRKALFSFIGASVLTLGLSVITFSHNPPQLTVVAFMFVVTLFTAFRFLQIRKNVEQELKTKILEEKKQ